MGLIKEMRADKLSVKVYGSRDTLGREAAVDAINSIKYLLSKKNEINIIFAAAPSQNEFIAHLVAEEGLEWEKINAFHMDEYVGLGINAPNGFAFFLNNKIFKKRAFKSLNFLKGDAENIDNECRRYLELLTKFPPDIVCMGIGENGHIAFNDPHVADFKDNQLVKVVKMDNMCRNQQVNDGCFESIDIVPTHAITLTVPALMAGKNIFCMVPAKSKARAVFETVTGKIDEICPASILRQHNNAILYTDLDSGSMLI